MGCLTRLQVDAKCFGEFEFYSSTLIFICAAAEMVLAIISLSLQADLPGYQLFLACCCLSLQAALRVPTDNNCCGA